MAQRPGHHMDDLGYDSYEAEGASEMFDEEQGYEDYDAAEDELGMEDQWDGAEEALFDEGFEEEFDEMEDLGDDYAADLGEEEALDDAMAYALGAEDTDEFFRRVARGIRRAASTVGRVARAAAPVARLIPHPYAQVAARGLGLLGKLRADGASEEEAMDAFAELAVYDESALPIAAGMAARSMLRNRGVRLPMPARRVLIQGVTNAARTLTAARGPKGIRALPRITRSVRRTAAVRKTPVGAIPQIIARTASNVVRTPNLARRLTQPLPSAVRRIQPILSQRGTAYTAGKPQTRTITVRGPVRISITSIR